MDAKCLPIRYSPQQVPQVGEESRAQSGSTPAIFSLDATSAAKQMAALNATSLHRKASQSGGTSDSLFGPRQSHLDTYVDSLWTQSNPLDLLPPCSVRMLPILLLKLTEGLWLPLIFSNLVAMSSSSLLRAFIPVRTLYLLPSLAFPQHMTLLPLHGSP